jgi:histidyl-tRNA synthetase
MELLRNFVGETEIGKRGIAEVETLFNYLGMFAFKSEIELDLTLARGLNYYTGAIFEVKSLEAQMGSICGGGRYDDLTGIFGLKDMSGVGISFGADRIFDVLEQLGKFPEKTLKGIDVLITNFGEKEVAYALPVLKKMRDSGISAVLYPDSSKLKKQMKYADDNSITYVVLVGDKEIENKTFTLKNMKSGEQFELSEQALLTMFVS